MKKGLVGQKIKLLFIPSLEAGKKLLRNGFQTVVVALLNIYIIYVCV
jgi:hypothetical protein